MGREESGHQPECVLIEDHKPMLKHTSPEIVGQNSEGERVRNTILGLHPDQIPRLEPIVDALTGK